jgi:excisionase family DNA binding protein
MQHSTTDNTCEYAGYPWLCEFCGVSIHTARRWVSERRVPHIKLAHGSLVRFKKSEIAAWLEASRVEAE